jgi:hypothetical protein
MTEDIGLSSDSVGMQMCHSIKPLHMPFDTVMDAAIISLFGVGGYLNLNDICNICVWERCALLYANLKDLKLFHYETCLAYC